MAAEYYVVDGGDAHYPATLKGLTDAIAEACEWASSKPVNVLHVTETVAVATTIAYTVPVQKPKPPRKGYC